jgi:hypothetical protein
MAAVYLKQRLTYDLHVDGGNMTSACMCARVPPAGRAPAVEQRLWDVLAPWIPQAGKLQLRWKSRGAHILCYPSVDALLIAGLYRKEHALVNPGLLLISEFRMSHQTLEACLTCSISCGRVRSWIASSTTIRWKVGLPGSWLSGPSSTGHRAHNSRFQILFFM